MSPIRGLTNKQPQFPEIGQLRKGAPKPKNSNAPGKDLTYFRFTSEVDGVMAKFYEFYDSEPRTIHVYLPFRTVEENFEAWQEHWVAGGLKHRCDGEYVVRIQGDNGEYTDPVTALQTSQVWISQSLAIKRKVLYNQTRQPPGGNSRRTLWIK